MMKLATFLWGVRPVDASNQVPVPVRHRWLQALDQCPPVPFLVYTLLTCRGAAAFFFLPASTAGAKELAVSAENGAETRRAFI